MSASKYGRYVFEECVKDFESKESRIATVIAHIAEAEAYRQYYQSCVDQFKDNPHLTDEQWNILDALNVQFGKCESVAKVFALMLDDDAPRAEYIEHVDELTVHFLAHLQRLDKEDIPWDYESELRLFAII